MGSNVSPKALKMDKGTKRDLKTFKMIKILEVCNKNLLNFINIPPKIPKNVHFVLKYVPKFPKAPKIFPINTKNCNQRENRAKRTVAVNVNTKKIQLFQTNNK